MKNIGFILVTLLVYLLKILNYWIIKIPLKLGIFSWIIYFSIIYFIFGTIEISKINHRIIGDNHLYSFLFGLFFVIPMVWAFFVTLGICIGSDDNGKTGFDRGLDGILYYRDQKMNHASPEKAYEIMKKTVHLDLMDKDPVFENAKIGFLNKYGNSGPGKIYEDFMK